MTTVFVGGSRNAPRLSADVLKRLDTIVEKGFPVVIGDANGADKAVQQYLHIKRYSKVEVFCAGGICRNNIGAWPIRSVAASTQEKNFQFYSAKDRIMAQEATIGLMMWDGSSVGTLLNVFRLLSLRKTAVVYVVPSGRFMELKSDSEWEDFLRSLNIALRKKVELKIKSETPSLERSAQMSFFTTDRSRGVREASG